jgi:two-component system phosphate regulon sensor histidine kinase PhoR
MKIGIRVKLFLATFVLICVILWITGLVLSYYLNNNLLFRIEGELTRLAEVTRALIANRFQNTEDWSGADELADHVGRAASVRVTIVLDNGKVIGDSNLEGDELNQVEDHLDRAEIKEALAKGFGKAVRFSNTLGQKMLYVAVAVKTENRRGVVRVSKPLSDVSRDIGGLRRILATAGLLGLVLAALMTAVASHLFSRRLKKLAELAAELVSGERDDKTAVSSRDEIEGLAGSLTVLADKIETHVTALAERGNQFEAVLDGMNEAVIALDEDNHVTLINRTGTMLLGISGEPTGKRLIESIRTPALHEITTEVERGRDKTAEFDLAGDPKRRIYARATRLQTGGVVVVLQDVTELRRLESIRRDFVSNVSHELRTPISIIQANAETMRDGAIEDKAAAVRFLTSMVENTQRLSNLIADLLDLSRIEEGQYHLQITSIALGTALRRAAAALETKAIERAFSIKVEQTRGLEVSADARALDQILFNLLDNAVKYTGRGGSVILRAKEVESGVRIEIEDNGPGIEPQYRERLFERFFRIDKGRSKEMGGTGLGLAIVKHLVSAMNGQVGMEPAKPQGSIFWFTLPSA